MSNEVICLAGEYLIYMNPAAISTLLPRNLTHLILGRHDIIRFVGLRVFMNELGQPAKTVLPKPCLVKGTTHLSNGAGQNSHLHDEIMWLASGRWDLFFDLKHSEFCS